MRQRRTKAVIYRLCVPLFATIVTACNITRTYERPVIQTNVIRGHAGTDTITMAAMRWQALVTDSKLASLLDRTLRNNYDYRSALNRINIARSTYLQSGAALLPVVNGQLTAADARVSRAGLTGAAAAQAVNLESQNYRAQITASWELDVWGRLAAARRSDLAALFASEAGAKAVKLQVLNAVTGYYLQLMAFDEQLKIARETVANRTKYLQTVRALKEAAIVNGAAVVAGEANLRAAELLIPDLEQNIRTAENAISVLAGTPAAAVDRDSLYARHFNFEAGKTGMSAQLLQYRPDVAQAEYNLRAAFENVNFAQASFYPNISLSAGGGINSNTLKNFFNHSVFYNLAANLLQPIVNARVNRTRLEIAEENRQIAFNNFNRTLLQAGAEVSNYLGAYNTALTKEDIRKSQIASLTKAVDFTEQLLKYSSGTNYNDVLVSEQNLLSARLNAVADRLQRLQAVMQVYTALGGGWYNGTNMMAGEAVQGNTAGSGAPVGRP